MSYRDRRYELDTADAQCEVCGCYVRPRVERVPVAVMDAHTQACPGY